jgi:hypothetical protein
VRTDEPSSIRIIDDRWTVVRHAVEAIAIVSAGIWAFYTFIYQERIKPAGEPAALTPSIEVRRLGRDPKREILSIDLHLKNTGKTELDIAANAYNVWGDTYAARQSTTLNATPQVRRYFHGLRQTSSTLIATFAELREAAGRRGYHIFIEPGAEDLLSYVVVVPRGVYDVIHAQVIMVPIKTGSPPLRVIISTKADGSSWLQPHEDDNQTDFALSP